MLACLLSLGHRQARVVRGDLFREKSLALVLVRALVRALVLVVDGQRCGVGWRLGDVR